MWLRELELNRAGMHADGLGAAGPGGARCRDMGRVRPRPSRSVITHNWPALHGVSARAPTIVSARQILHTHTTHTHKRSASMTHSLPGIGDDGEEFARCATLIAISSNGLVAFFFRFKRFVQKLIGY